MEGDSDGSAAGFDSRRLATEAELVQVENLPARLGAREAPAGVVGATYDARMLPDFYSAAGSLAASERVRRRWLRHATRSRDSVNPSGYSSLSPRMRWRVHPAG
jgi:hypothetical protein